MSDRSISFWVPGWATKGSITNVPSKSTGRMVAISTGSKDLKLFMNRVESKAAELWGAGPPTDRGAKVVISLRVDRPKSHLTASGSLRKGAPEIPSRPDVDKLTRAVFDALTGVVWKNDAQVYSQWTHKEYASDGKTGVTIDILTEE